MTKSKLKINDKFTFNEELKQYVFHTEEKFGKNYVFKADKVETILRLYSNFDKVPYTMGEIAQRTCTPKKVIEFILKALDKNHACLPFTDEKIKKEDEEDLANQMINEKSFNISQKFEKKEWLSIASDAEKWRSLKFSTIDPFVNFLEKWAPPKYFPSVQTHKSSGDEELLIGCSDWHFGLVANERYLYSQKEWNIAETKKAVASYARQLKQHIIERNCYKKIKLLFLGDLLHTLSGYTDKGTQLEANPIGEEQLEQAFNSIVLFVEELLSVSSNIEVFSCSGNHSSLGDYVVIKMLSLYFRNDPRLKFEITNKRNIGFSIGRNLFLMEHGYSAVTKNRLPQGNKARENYINNLFMAKPDDLYAKTNRYYLSADQHHMESYELTNVEGYMFPTLVGGCRHSDNSGYKSRPRQLALSVNGDGIKEVINFYFK